jgi:thymidylate synthase (FAD)
MAETKMSVKLLAHTQLTDEFLRELAVSNVLYANALSDTDGQTVALTAIRTCYSPLLPSEIAIVEGQKYFGKAASDGGTGTDADRLFRMIVKSGHTSTLEHLTFTFAVEGVSRSLLAQLTRHRVGFSFSVQSQRYVKLGSGDKSGGFDYVVPDKIRDNPDALYRFEGLMEEIQRMYDKLRELGIPAEDARAVLPNATATNLTMTSNLRALLDFYSKRRKGRGAQAEIAELAERLRQCVTEVEPWVDPYFEQS